MAQPSSEHKARPDVLGVFSSFDELAEPDLRLGRKVANYGFISAILEHSGLDGLHFYLPFYSALPNFEKVYAHWLNMPRNQKRVKLLPALNLQAALQQTRYLAIHAVEHHRYFPELCHQRNHWSGEPFPITCTPHSLHPWEAHARNIYKVLPGPMSYDSIFCTSRAAKEHLSQSFGALAEGLAGLGLESAGYNSRLDIVPLGVDAREFASMSQAQALKRLELPPGPVTILCVGRLTPTDKFDLLPLLGVLKLLSARHDLRLILAGAGHENYVSVLKKTAAGLGVAERLHLFEDFASEIKPALFAAADIFVSPVDNLQETFGLSIIEAMAAGLPVVASDFSGYRDLVVNGRTGVLIPTLGPSDYRVLDASWPMLHSHIASLQMAQRTALDMGALLSALAGLAASPDTRRDMGRAGHKRVLKLFDWPVVIRSMEQKWFELKAQALQHGKPDPPPDVIATSQKRLFGAFPSGEIDPDLVVEPGPLAAEFISGTWHKESHADLAGYLPLPLLRRILELVDQSGGKASLSDLQETLKTQAPAFAVEHLLLHGLKYGVLQTTGNGG
jgi:glycosyltransferase involved in cell wall biosynthesis